MMQENIPEITPETKPAISKKKSFLSRFFKLLIFCVLLIMIAAIGILWQKSQQFHQDIQTIHNQLKNLNYTQEIFQKNTHQTLLNFSEQLAAQKNMFAQLKTQFSSVLNQTPAGDIRAFKIEQMAYLIRMAQIELNIHYNIPQALVLLKQTENLLNQLNSINPANVLTTQTKFNHFHPQLLKTITLLQMLPVIDTDKLLAQLDQLKTQTANLSILVAPKPNTSILADTPHQAHKKWFQRAWDNIKASLQALVIIRHEENKIPALMSPQEQLYLQQNLQMLLIQAQWALIHHDDAVYRRSLHEANAWVEKYYVQNSASTISFLKLLQPLMTQPVSPALPDLQPLLISLQQEA